ncbi:MAG: LAGLIDADG family homing endonuclease [Nanoarchaeota archaeon]
MNWTSDFAYVVGLITTDGCLSKDGRHIDFTSKDLEQVKNFVRALNPKIRITSKKSSTGIVYPRVQFSDVNLYRYLISIGLHSNKSKTLKSILVPDIFFADFLRGCFDGDGCTYSYWDKRWKSSFLLYLSFVSASLDFLKWLQGKIENLYKAKGTIKDDGKSAFQLIFAKKSSLIIIRKMYHSPKVTCLTRKKSKISKSLGIIRGQSRSGETGILATLRW